MGTIGSHRNQRFTSTYAIDEYRQRRHPELIDGHIEDGRQQVERGVGWNRTTRATIEPPFIHSKLVELQHLALNDW
jgi:hypothetical protein